MKTFCLSLLLFVAALADSALGAPPSPPVQPAPEQASYSGVLERRVASGGETTGWVLRYDKSRTIELTFTLKTLPLVREGLWVVCTGTIETRHYPERGDVRVLVVREMHEIVT